MEANELRIGNYTEYHIIDENKDKWIFNKIVLYDMGDIGYIRPIPLTDKWLLKFGWDKAVNGWWDESECYSIENGMFRIGTDEVIKCKSVHQLQNLYFALTNKELTSVDGEK